MVVVVVGDGVLAVGVLGFNEQQAGREFTVWPRAVLGGDDWSCVACSRSGRTAISIQADVLTGLSNQAFVSVQIVAALGLGQWVACFVAVLFFPQAAV